MNDFLAIYLILGLVFTALSLFSKETTQILAERSLLWRLLWAVLVTALWLPVFLVSAIIVLKQRTNKENEK